MKTVYFFGDGSADGQADMKNLLGGKGANLAEMTSLGLLDIAPDLKVPNEVIAKINVMFLEVEQGANPNLLHRELSRWGLFHIYENRFYKLFHKQ